MTGQAYPDWADVDTDADSTGKLRYGFDFVSEVDIDGDATRIDSDATDIGPADSTSFHGLRRRYRCGATDNGIGVAGVGRSVSIMPLEFWETAVAVPFDILQGNLYAA